MLEQRRNKVICSHTVIVKKRVIERNQQHYVEEEYQLELHPYEVRTPTETIRMEDVHDVSYRGLSETYGFLYLHTIKGVQTFMVREEPTTWINAYRQL
ncbi:hypothetical protein EQV77_11520 [Halobacillus fulvus]|nr:hypothetical protein EQV77_11520 [Halobacillus fulvus]